MGEGLRVLVCGGRDYDDGDAIFAALNDVSADRDIVEIIQGGARGADSWAKRWAEISQINCRTYEANWKKHGKLAGPMRNERMLVEGKPNLVVAFPGGRGTADMVRRARDFGVEVIHFSPQDQSESGSVQGGSNADGE